MANYYKNIKLYELELPLDTNGSINVKPGEYVFGSFFARAATNGLLEDEGSGTPSEVTADPTLLIYSESVVPISAPETPVNGVTATYATTTLTSDATAVTDGDTVTIGSTVYTFKTSLSTGPAVAFEVLIGSTSNGAAALDNLKSAINGTTGEGTTYATGTTSHPSVTATTNTNTTQLIRAITAGTAANSLATTTTASHLSWAGSTVNSGTPGIAGVTATTGAAGTVAFDATYLYIATADNVWKRITLSSF